jgi:hypothetical protein
VLPRAVERFLPDAGTQAEPALSSQELRRRAGLAAASTAALVRLSAALESARAAAGIDPFSHPLPDTGAAFFSSQANLLVLFALALLQWKALDGRSELARGRRARVLPGAPSASSRSATWGAGATSISAVDYRPLRALDDLLAAPLLGSGGGGGFGLGLPSVTSPCYFAVATDAIALGRLFDSQDRQERRRGGEVE